jgi:hypothetical protein
MTMPVKVSRRRQVWKSNYDRERRDINREYWRRYYAENAEAIRERMRAARRKDPSLDRVARERCAFRNAWRKFVSVCAANRKLLGCLE